MEAAGGPPPKKTEPTPEDALTAPIRTLLQDWRDMALKASGRHSAACDRYEHMDSLYGIGSTVLTAIVGSTIFVTLQKTASETIRIVAGLVAAIAAVASGIQTAAKYGQLAERYRQASRHYATVARRIDEILADPPPDQAQMTTILDQLRKSLDDTGAMAPNVPPRIWSSGPDEDHHLAFPSHHDALRESASAAKS
jgi:hypothetical protein